MPVLAMDVPRRAEHDLFGDGLDRGRQVHLPLREQALRSSRRAAEQVVELPRGHRQPLAVIEVAHIHAIGAVFFQVQEPLENQVLVDRLAVGGQAHDLVFAAVDAEAGVIGECGVQQAEGMREADFVGQFDPVAAPVPKQVVDHSPTPSKVMIAASSKGDGKKALAACDSW